MLRALSLTILLVSAAAAQQTTIRMESGTFRVTGWQAVAPPAEGWESVFAVYAGQGDVPAMLGAYSVQEGSLVFRPRFPIALGMHVRAVFRMAGAASLEAEFDIPKAEPAASTTRVTHVYPSIDVLPENQLKFYISFSAPMRRGLAWQKIHLVDQQGTVVQLPFLELDEELWDPDTTRLTVLFDPGRIKRGLLPLEEIGPSIVEGKRYTLVIDRDWQDGRGAPLAGEFRKEFRVGPAERNPPDPSKWRIQAPRTGTLDPLVIDFPKPLDFALLQHSLTVRGPDGPIVGNIEIQRDETQWRFTPALQWKTGEYQVVIQTILEDLAGNHIGRAFDVDTFDPITKNVQRETVSIPFRIHGQ